MFTKRKASRFLRTVPAMIGAAAVLLAQASPGLAGQYPEKPIHLIVPYAPGGTTDIVSRVLAQALGKELSQPVVVENRAGAGGMVGAAALARAEADGYTLGTATVSTVATGPLTAAKPSYDPLKAFTPVGLIAFVPNVLTVYPGIPAQNLKEFVSLLKANPGKYSFASSGVGSIAHLDGELFKSLTDVQMTHVPYRGSGPALNDTAAGQVAAQFDNLSSSLAFIQAGKLRALAVASEKRVPQLPDVPTYAEAGIPQMNNMAWFGVVGPKGLPDPVRDRLLSAMSKVLSDPAVIEIMHRNGAEPKAMTPQAFGQVIEREYALRKRIVEERHITIE